MPGFVERAGRPRRARSSRSARWRGSATRGSVAGSAPSKMTRSHGRPSWRSGRRAVLGRRDAEQLDVGQVATARSRGTGRPAPTTRISRSRSGGTIAQARSSTASWSGARGRRPDRGRRAGPRASRRRRGTSSMTTSGRACGSSGRSRTSMQAAVAPHLEPARGALEVEVGDADEDRPGHGRRRGPDGERDDRLVLAARGRPAGP